MISEGSLLGAYKILSKIGAGGMGEIYRARDLRLGREVAIKVVSSELHKDPTALARFESEARAVAALSHPNILAIHEFDEDKGTLYAVMELLEGETLRGRLISAGPIPWRKAVETAKCIAEGLAAAHSKAIVHRDLKPENIFLTRSGQVKILDFGLARVKPVFTDQKKTTTDISEETTESGLMLGTVAYMSPEQVHGHEADERSDLFSLGCVLYEMLNGKHPFSRETVWETATAIAKEMPADFESTGVRVPLELQKIVSHCLEKNADERFQSARDLVFALKNVAENQNSSGRTQPLLSASGGIRKLSLKLVTVVAVLLTIAGLLYWLIAKGQTIRTIAILPLANLSTDTELDYLSDGISEGVINNLAQIGQLRVMARSTVFQYRGRVDPRKAGKELGVDAVLAGWMQQENGRITINVELVRVSDGSSLWGERFTRSPSQVIDVEEVVSRQIAARLSLKLTGEQERRLNKRNTDSPGAYHLYLKGRYFANKRTAEGMKKGMEFFQKALDQDPVYALAYAGISDGYSLLGDYAQLPPNEAYTKAKAAAIRAIEIDEELAEAHTSLGHVYVNLWNFQEADAQYRRALELNPNYALAHQWYANYLIATGNTREALAHIQIAVDLDPLSMITNSVFGWQLYLAKQYDQAEAQLRKTLETDPSFAPAYATLGEVYVEQKKYPEALAAFQKAIEVSPENTDYRGMLAHASAVAGDLPKAREILTTLEQTSERAYVSPVYRALIYKGLGENTRALELLRQAYEEKSEFLVFINVYPPFETLKSNPEFQKLLYQMGLSG